ncbi:NAD(P)H-binding protein [Ferrovibrio xuzhouensis]|uniref:NAD(P)H-binding protein n=1 Tax=Ferrovibrio xuzhouensis TaxID=1576914 RepID=A0ABV7VIC5_9PROT
MNLLIAGATGLIGGLALRHALAEPRVTAVTCIGRRTLPLTDPKLTQVTADFARLDDSAAGITAIDAALCGLGTTIRQAGSRQAFHAVDHDAVLAFARLAKAKGARRFAVVSSVGASSRSGTFYLATKGRMEDGLEKIGFERLAILQPSFLLGERTKKRPGEGYATAFAQLIAPLLLGDWHRYRPIDADAVARALLQAVLADPAPAERLTYDGILALARR